jgi:intracellular sulfur oxidation DsrE/DsrF family protein
LHSLLVILLLSLAQAVLARTYSNPQVEQLLASAETPDGVVFELLSRDENTWTWAAPMIADLRQQLRNRFPGMDIAVVSHGREQFQLTREKALQQPEAISTLNDLVQQGVSLHVCGTHSAWKNVAEDNYIEIVDVASSGPAQINDYVKLGYVRIRLHPPTE